MASKTPKFSIIVGMYNHRKYLLKFVESLTNQDYKNFEVHFCDDGSDDGTREFFETLKAPFDWQYHRQPNKGMRLAKNLNQGIKQARGKYCLFIMSDSFPKEDYVDLMNDYASRNKVLCGVRLQIANNVMVDIDYRVKREIVPKHTAILVKEAWRSITGNGLCVPTKAFKERGRGWDERFKGYGGEDTELGLWLFFSGYVFHHIHNAILFHNYHGTSVPTERSKKLLEKCYKEYEKGNL